jgi:hypothetical protein
MPNYTLLACGSGAGLIPIIYAALACWMASGGFFVANFCLMFALRDGPLLRHGSALLLYSALGLAAYSQAESGADNGFLLVGCTVGLPPIIIGHFILLFRLVRRERRALRAEPDPS